MFRSTGYVEEFTCNLDLHARAGYADSLDVLVRSQSPTPESLP
ncbi:hypothetical protein [Novosphingobium sp. CECT 9465]|nr:hypothetical protein [Novosphingobium sp. CECT 9465]